jgi:hypothetical protein
MGDAIGVIVFLIIIIISVIGRIIQAAADRTESSNGGGAGRGGEGQYSASPDDIRQFLEGLESPRRAQQTKQRQQPPAPPRQAPPEPEPAPTRLAEQSHDTWETGSGQEQGMPSGPVLEQPTSGATGRSAEKKAARRRALAARKKKLAAQRKRKAAVTSTEPSRVSAPGKDDLKSAVIWSEILGPPVSRRRRPGHRPPGLRE